MRFAWAPVLFAVLALPVMVAIYLRRQRRRRPAVVYPSLDLVRAALPRRAGWKRHVPFALVLAALAVLTVAGARPQLRMNVPVASSAIILALDVSGSMCATDVDPNRLAAAQDAVRTFVRDQNDRTRIGLVVFSGSAQIAVAPSTDRGELIAALDGLTVGRGTAIGAAILKSVDAIALLNPDVAAPATPTPDSAPGQTPDHAPEIVVLLTDGANTRGVTPQVAAVQAAERGVRIYPVGFGTKSPKTMACTASQLSGGSYGGGGGGFGGPGGGGGGGGQALIADDEALKTVAKTTGGEFFSAETADQLNTVLSGVKSRLGTIRQDVDLSAGFAVIGSLLLLAGALVTLRRNPLG